MGRNSFRLRDENNYEIHVYGLSGVVVKAWHYEAPHSTQYASSARIDPRDVRPDVGVDGMIRKGVKQVHKAMDGLDDMELARTPDTEGEGET